MKKRLGKNSVLAIALVMGLVLAGCGSNKSADAAAMYTTDSTASYETGDVYSYDNYALETEAAAEEPAAENGAPDSPDVQDTERKLIRNVNMEVETEDFDVLMQTLEEKTERLNGYIESNYTYNGSSYSGRNNRNASLIIRIPADKLKDFLASVAENSNIISQNDSVQDVTLQYVDMDSHKKALLAEQTRLLELLEQAETIEDIITLESRLSDVRYQIESMESQLRAIDNQVSYSTITLEISEVVKYTPVKEMSRGEQIVTGFAESMMDVWEGILDFIVDFIIALPYLVLWAIIITAIVFIIKGIIRGRRKKKLKKQEKAQMKEQQAEQQKEQQKEKDKSIE